MKVTKPLIPEQLRLESYDPQLHLNHSGELYANPVATAALDATGLSPTDLLLFDQIAETEVALHWVPRGTKGARKVRRPKSGNTASFSASPILLLFPRLRVPAGRIRLIPFRIDQTEEGAMFVMEINKEESITSSRHPGKKSIPAVDPE